MSKKPDILVLDYESFWSNDYSLSKMSTIAYVRHPEFKIHGAALRLNGAPAEWVTGSHLQGVLDNDIDWANTILIGHNLPFDGLILAERNNHWPKLYIDTLGMARCLIGGAIPSRSLDALGEHFGLSGKLEKGKALYATRGVRDLSPYQEAEMAKYACHDADLTAGIFNRMWPEFPKKMLSTMDWTIRMMTEPGIVLNADIMRECHETEVEMKRNAVANCRLTKTQLNSNNQFADILREHGIEPPTKISRTTGKETYAFSKTDQAFTDLQDDPNPDVRDLVMARLAVKSSIEETRSKAYLELAEDGKLCPVPLLFCGAMQTGRLSGADGFNWQNIGRSSRIRDGVEAPDGFVFVEADSSNIELRVVATFCGQNDLVDTLRAGGDAYSDFAATLFNTPVTKALTKSDPVIAGYRQTGKVSMLACLAEGTEVLTLSGLKGIEHVTTDDLLWDGVEWVRHDGVVFNGVRPVIQHDGLTATPDHRVFLEDGREVGFVAAAIAKARLARTGAGEQPLGLPDCFVDHSAARRGAARGERAVLLAGMRSGVVGEFRELPRREDDALQGVRAPQGIGGLGPFTEAHERGAGALSKPDYAELSQVRREGHRVPVSERRRGGELDRAEPSELAERGSRPGEQRRSLRAGEPARVHTQGERREPREHRTGAVDGCTYPSQRMEGEPLRAVTYRDEVRSAGNDGRADHRASASSGSGEAEELARDCGEARVYDILNAGPRNRFTANGRLVHNCQYGVGARTFQKMLWVQAGLRVTEDEAERIVKLYRKTYSKISGMWKLLDKQLDVMASGQAPHAMGNTQPVKWHADRIELPSGFCLKYPELRWVTDSQTGRKQLAFTSYGGKSAGTKYLWGGTLLENCLAGDTEVATLRGWVRLASVRPTDLVWDGVTWVRHSGLVCNGERTVIDVGGVRMTADHRVWVGEWREAREVDHGKAAEAFASSFEGPHWRAVRHEHGGGVCGVSDECGWRFADDVAGPLQLRHRDARPRQRVEKEDELSLSTSGIRHQARHVEASGVLGLAQYARSVPPTDTPGVVQLRSAWHSSMRTLGQVRRLLGRHGANVLAWFGLGPREQRRALRAGELPVGDATAEQSQQEEQHANRSEWGVDEQPGRGSGYGCGAQHADVPMEPRRSRFGLSGGAERKSATVYDIRHAGHNNRFTVRGADGRPFLVHNCGQALAREIIDPQVQKIRQRYPVLLQVHDAVLALVPESEAEEGVAYVRECMSEAPIWWADIPIACEAGFGKTYGGIKKS